MPEVLLKGFQEFRKKAYEGHDPIMKKLVENGQNPDYFIISCIDSRANPGSIFNPPPGTFFAHKAMGAIVRPYQKGTALAAALQFAFHHNKVKTLIVMGHTGCGAIDALIKGIPDSEISSFLDVAQKGLHNAIKLCPEDDDSHHLHRVAEEQIVLESIENLKKYPSVAEAIKENRVDIRGWLFDMEEGQIYQHNSQSNQFEILSSEEAK